MTERDRARSFGFAAPVEQRLPVFDRLLEEWLLVEQLLTPKRFPRGFATPQNLLRPEDRLESFDQSSNERQNPSAEELVFLDACLRAIPHFIESNAPSQTRQVETGTRRVELHLAWNRRSNRSLA
jgi:hypothetical protein